MEYEFIRHNEDGSIDINLNHPLWGWIPFTASPEDPEEMGREIYEIVAKEHSKGVADND